MNTFNFCYLLSVLPYTIYGPFIRSLTLASVAKCMPIILLMINIVFDPKSRQCSYGRKIFAALLTSMIGDYYILCMETVSRSYLIYGIIYFAMAHIFYIWAFGSWNIRFIDLVLVIGLVAPSYFLHKQIMVSAYSLILLSMANRALYYHNRYIRMAAVTFVISDTILALTEITGLIVLPKYLSHVSTLSSYYCAQFLFFKSIEIN